MRLRTSILALLLPLVLCGCQPGTQAPARSYAAPGGSQTALAGLSVSEGTGTAGYRRELFGPAWTDDYVGPWGHDGCDTRSQVLRRDAVTGSVLPVTGCRVRTGAWVSPYTGQRVTEKYGVQVDHVVPLGYAWAHGASRWSTGERVAYANDPGNLLAVDARSNESKGDRGPSRWRPPLRSAWCGYATGFVLVARARHLSVTSSDKSVLGEMLGTCGERD